MPTGRLLDACLDVRNLSISRLDPLESSKENKLSKNTNPKDMMLHSLSLNTSWENMINLGPDHKIKNVPIIVPLKIPNIQRKNP